jgi:hypothetical protein
LREGFTITLVATLDFGATGLFVFDGRAGGFVWFLSPLADLRS